MKKSFVLFCITFLFAGILFAQEQTFLSGEVEHGGFGGPVVKFTSIKKNFAVLVGGYGGWIINHQFVIGGGGFGLVNYIDADPLVKPALFPLVTEDIVYQFGYGGAYLEYINESNKLVHYSFSTLIGGGAVNYITKTDFRTNHDSMNDVNALFVLEPAINVELNIISFFRINAGVGYRFVSGVDLPYLRNSDLSNFTTNLGFKFGAF